MFELRVEKNDIKVTTSEDIVSNSVNVYKCHFGFSDDWDGLQKTAVFKAGKKTKSMVLGPDDECVIPWEVLHRNDEKYLFAGVFGTLSGVIVLPTIWAKLGYIHEGVDTDAACGKQPRLDVYEQILDLCGKTNEIAKNTMEEMDKIFGIEKMVWVSDLDWTDAKQDFESTNKDKNCVGEDITLRDGNGKVFVCKKGIGTHANSEIDYDFYLGDYDAFESYIGVNALGDTEWCEGIKFRIYGYGPSGTYYELYRDDSEVFTQTTPAKYIHVDIPDDVFRIKIVIQAAGGTGAAWGNWGGAKLIKYKDGNPCGIEEQIKAIERTMATAYDVGFLAGFVNSSINYVNEKVNAANDKINETKDAVGVEKIMWLSDIDWVSAKQDYETTNKDRNCKGGDIALIDSEGKVFICQKGIGTHAVSQVRYNFNQGEYDAFESFIGVNALGDTGYCQGLKFRVYCSNASGYEYELYRNDDELFVQNTPAKYVHIDIPRDSVSMLLCVEAPNGTSAAWANWGEAKLIKHRDGNKCSVEDQIKAIQKSMFGMPDMQGMTEEQADGRYAKKDNAVITGSFSQNRKENSTIGDWSHAEGSQNIASEYASHAEGSGNTASGHSSHVEGTGNKATGNNDHVEGSYNTGSGISSHTEGRNNDNSGNYSHVEGSYNVVKAQESHVEGVGNISSRMYQHVEGRYNIEDNTVGNVTTKGKYIHIVGNGTDANHRSNAHTLDWEGNTEYSGDVIAMGCGGDNPISLVELSKQVASVIDKIVNGSEVKW